VAFEINVSQPRWDFYGCLAQNLVVFSWLEMGQNYFFPRLFDSFIDPIMDHPDKHKVPNGVETIL
jgi:hypothetical protein